MSDYKKSHFVLAMCNFNNCQEGVFFSLRNHNFKLKCPLSQTVYKLQLSFWPEPKTEETAWRGAFKLF